MQLPSKPSFFWIFLLVLVLASAVEASQGQVYLVTAPTAAVYQKPAEATKTTKQLSRGRRVQVAGDEENGFLPVDTRTGTRVWLRARDLTPEEVTSGDLEPVEPRNRSDGERRSGHGSMLGLKRLTFDLGASGGSTGNVAYTEVQLGFNAYFYDWLAWRNALFGRFPSEGTSVYGLDSSVRGILDLSGAIGGITVFAGPGVRFPNKGAVTPFAEAGAVFKLVGLAIGGGAKVVLNSYVQSGAANDTQYFIILAGGGSL